MIISDPKQISYRMALQKEYEMILRDLIILIADLSTKPKILDKDFEFLTDKVRDFANDYMELQSSYWKKMNFEIREKIIETVTENLVTQIPNYKNKPELVEAFIVESMPTLIHALFLQCLEAATEQPNQAIK